MNNGSEPLIKLDQVSKVFVTDEVETHALAGIHFEVQRGEYLSISGPSGCGKSTLLAILGLLDTPVHGKPGQVRVLGGDLLAGLPAEFTGARYHSLHARTEQVTGGFEVTAVTQDGVVMAIEDPDRGRWGVQFHPESILSIHAGHLIIGNVLRLCRER